MRAFSDTLFIPRPEEMALLEARFAKLGTSWDGERKWRAKELWRRCPRVIPEIETLHPALVELFRTCGSIKDAKTGAPLFNNKGWADAKGVLASVLAGHVSDPPGVALYYPLGMCGGRDGKLRDGVRIWRCCRGTSPTEGGCHKPLRDRMRKAGVSVQHAAARLKDFTLHHNLVVRVSPQESLI